KSWSFRTRQRRLGPRTIPCTHRCKRRSLQAAVELRGREKRARRLQDLVRPHQLRHFLAQGPDLLALGGGHARLLSSVDARPVHPAAHSVGRDPSQVMQVPQRRPHRLARHLLPPLVEHPDDPVLRLLVVLGSHASFSPFAWKESLHQTQCGSLSWLDAHNHALRFLGGVPLTVRIDNLKTGVKKGAGAWAELNDTYQS